MTQRISFRFKPPAHPALQLGADVLHRGRKVLQAAILVSQAGLTAHDPDGAYEPYDINATLVDGPRKLWDVVPLEQEMPQASSDMRESPLIGRLVSVDEDGAAETAIAIFQLQEGEFCVRQV